MTRSPGAEPGLSPLWPQAAALTFIVGFAILGYLTFRVYQEHPPVPGRVIGESGEVLFDGGDVRAGQELFLTYGLMEYGSVYGHGAYLGPDFTADYLHREAVELLRIYGGSRDAGDRVRSELRANRYDAATDTLTLTNGQVEAFNAIRDAYSRDVFDRTRSGGGIGPHAVIDPAESRRMTAFIAWTAWTAAAQRPGKLHSYTNNWPPEALAGNTLTQEAVVWSALSIVALLGGIGVLLTFFGRYSTVLGWHREEQRVIRFLLPSEVALTPGQRATAWYFFIVSALFLVQTLLGGVTAHYHAETGGFFGIDLARWLPYNLTRTWHLQLSLFFVVAAYLAAGIFLAPIIAGSEPRRQRSLAFVLLAALVIVVVGSLTGEAASYKGWLDGAVKPLLGAQGWEYLDLGRLWQLLLIGGLVVWCAILWRGLRSRLRTDRHGNLPYLLIYSALSLPVFYAVGLLSRSQTNFAVADFWRFWVVHLWVEDFMELFTTILVAYIFVLLGVVSERTATRVVYLDVLLYSIGGVVGTMHHLYFSGTPAIHMALGAFFSAAEVIPLTFLTVEAWTFLQLGAQQQAANQARFPHRWAVLFLAAVGFWNFLGAGVFGFLINLPVVSYYEIGTQLTANHGHAAMMGVYGMLAIALLVFCLRYLIREEDWSERLVGFSFWGLNLGLAWMIFANLFPVGLLQLADVVTNGYWHARSLEFFDQHAYLEWLRFPGDALFIAAVVPLVVLTARAVLRPAQQQSATDQTGASIEGPLFTEIVAVSNPR